MRFCFASVLTLNSRGDLHSEDGAYPGRTNEKRSNQMSSSVLVSASVPGESRGQLRFGPLGGRL